MMSYLVSILNICIMSISFRILLPQSQVSGLEDLPSVKITFSHHQKRANACKSGIFFVIQVALLNINNLS